MRGIFYIITLFMVAWLTIMIRFNCTNLDQDRCRALCTAQGKEYRGVDPGFIKTCHCRTDWLKKERERRDIQRRLREQRRN